MSITKKVAFYSYDATPDGNVAIPALLKAFQQLAREDCDSYGVTYPDMRKNSQIFVLIKIKLRFNKEISIYDDVTVESVPIKISGVTFYRDFFVRNSDGETLCLCTTAWVLIDYEKRSILRPSALIGSIEHHPDLACGLSFSRSFSFDDNDSPASRTYVRNVYYSNLDENNHMNNAEISSFAVDSVADRLIAGSKITNFEIHFDKEVHLNDVLNIRCFDSPSASHVYAENETNSFKAFEAFFEFVEP